MPLPAEFAAARARISARTFDAGGAGIEIGALDVPTPVPRACSVQYVDLRSNAELAAQYPRLDAGTFVPVDVIDDGERLSAFAPESLDFLIAHHMLEHCENPLGTLRRHLEVLKPGGHLFYALPDRRVSFDRLRPVTTFEHLVADDTDQGAGSRDGHYLEWATLVNGFEGEAAIADARKVAGRRYSIHFHVWDADAWLECLMRARGYLHRCFEVVHFEFLGTEILCVLRKPKLRAARGAAPG